MIDCAFKGHVQRAAICEGGATSFFRTAKGVVWPLCGPCAERHKKLILGLADRLPSAALAGAVFDLPLDDPKSLDAWKTQDPKLIKAVIDLVDARYAELMRRPGD